jgi:predicted nucleic acid-binding protein
VVDADCLIAGVLTSEGATSALLDRWQAGAFELVVCPRLIGEVLKALVSERLAARYDIPAAEANAFCLQLSQEGLLSDDPREPPRVVPDDPNDDYLIALALSSGSGFLVTRDRHFDKVKGSGVRSLGPRGALELSDE